MDQEMASSIQDLIDDLSNDDETIRMNAHQSLVKIGGYAVPHLIEAIKRGDNIVIDEAAQVLFEIKEPKAAFALVEALEDDQSDIRWLAAKGLIQMGSKAIDPLLHALRIRGDSMRLREGANAIVREFVNGEFRNYWEPVMKALDGVEAALSVLKTAMAPDGPLKEAVVFDESREQWEGRYRKRGQKSE